MFQLLKCKAARTFLSFIFQIYHNDKEPLIKKETTEPQGSHAYDDVAEDEEPGEDNSDGSVKKPVRKAPPLPPGPQSTSPSSSPDQNKPREGCNPPGDNPGPAARARQEEAAQVNEAESHRQNIADRGAPEVIHERGSHHSYEEIAASEVSTEVRPSYTSEKKLLIFGQKTFYFLWF